MSDLVWAKLYPYTWCPGQIRRRDGSKALVSFFGRGRRSKWFHSYKVLPFEENYARVCSMLESKLRAEVDSALEVLSRSVGLRHMCQCRGGGSGPSEVGALLSPEALVGFVKGRAVCAWAAGEEAAGLVRMATQVLAFRCVGIGGLVESFDPVGFLGLARGVAVCCSGEWTEGAPFDQVLVHVVALRRFMSSNPVWVPDTMDSDDSVSGSDDYGSITSSVDDEDSEGSFLSDISDSFSVEELLDDFVEEKQEEEHDICLFKSTDKYFCTLNKADHSLLDSGEPFEYLSDHQLDKCRNSSRTSPLNKYLIHPELPLCRTNRIHFCLADASETPLTGYQIGTSTNSSGYTGRCLDLEEEHVMKWLTDSDEPWDFDAESVSNAAVYSVASVVELHSDSVSQNDSNDNNKDIISICGDTTNERLIESLDHNNTSVSGNTWNAEKKVEIVSDLRAEQKQNYPTSLPKIASPDREHLSIFTAYKFNSYSPHETLKQLRSLASDPLHFGSGYFDSVCANLIQFKYYLLKTGRGAACDHHLENQASVLKNTWQTKQKEAEDYSELGYAPKQNCSSPIPQFASFVEGQLSILPASKCNTCSHKALEQLHILASDPFCFELEDLDFYRAYFLNFKNHLLEISESAVCDDLLKMIAKKTVFNFGKNSLVVASNAKNYQGDGDGSCKNNKFCNAEVSHRLLPILSDRAVKSIRPRVSHVSNDVENHTVTRVHEKKVLDQTISIDQRKLHKIQASYSLRRPYVSPLVPDSPIGDKDAHWHRSLHMKFPKGFKIPSKQELERKFAVFGHLDHARTKVFFYTGSAEVVFLCSEDAQTAYQFARRKKVYSHANVRFWFDRHEKYREGRNNQAMSVSGVLEQSTLNLKSCLKRPHTHLMSDLKQKKSMKFAMDVKTSSLNGKVTAKSVPLDISEAMLQLLIKCDKLVVDIKKNLGLESYNSMFTDGYSCLSKSGS